MREVIVDMVYCGDFTDIAQEMLQPYIVVNDINGFLTILQDKEQWRDFAIPSERYSNRLAILERQVANIRIKSK